MLATTRPDGVWLVAWRGPLYRSRFRHREPRSNPIEANYCFSCTGLHNLTSYMRRRPKPNQRRALVAVALCQVQISSTIREIPFLAKIKHRPHLA
jgi:hypothetical protein